MTACICGDSAERLIASRRDAGFEDATYLDESDLDGFLPSWKDAREIAREVWGENGMRIDLLVTKPGARRPSSSVSYHVWSAPIPNRSLIRFPDGVVVCSPQFNLLLQSKGLSDVEVCKRISKMTAAYSEAKGQAGVLPECDPLVERELLESYLVSARGLRGARRIIDLMSYAPSLARSPREIDFVLPLVFPRDKGGCGLPMPTLNKRIELDLRAKVIMGKEVCFADAFWESPLRGCEGFVGEYLGKSSHPNFGEDLARRLALQSMGFEVELVADEQLKDARQLGMIARRVASVLDIDLGLAGWPTTGQLQGLIDEVLATKV